MPSPLNKILVSYWWKRQNGSNTYIQEYVSEELMDSVSHLEDLRPAYLKSKGLNASDLDNWCIKVESAPKFTERKKDWLEPESES